MTCTFSDILHTHSISKAGCHEKFSMHTHTTAEIFCFLSGKAKYHVEGSEYELKSGDILLMRPAEAHYIDTDPSQDYERIYVNFETDIFASLDPENTLLRPFFQREAGTRNLYRALDFGDNGYLALLRHMLSTQDRLTILADLILLLKQIEQCFHEGVHALPKTAEYRIMHYINSNLDKELSLRELCDRFYISRAQLCRMFQKATGTTVGKYIAAKRLITARQQILEGHKPSEVFVACGYKDYSTFYRAYYRYFGHSPRSDVGNTGPADFLKDRMEIR